jgi:hypothetical protein
MAMYSPTSKIMGRGGYLPTPPKRAIGLDLAQSHDYTALALLEWQPPARGPVPHYDVRALRRWPLGTRYTEVVADLGKLLKMPEMDGTTLMIDETGVGRAVCEMVLEMLARFPVCVKFTAVTITAGRAVTFAGPCAMHVAKVALVSCLDAAFQADRLRFAEGLAEGPAMIKELQTFRRTVTPAGNETAAAWREKDRDDLVLSLALAQFYAEHVAPLVDGDEGDEPVADVYRTSAPLLPWFGR